MYKLGNWMLLILIFGQISLQSGFLMVWKQTNHSNQWDLKYYMDYYDVISCSKKIWENIATWELCCWTNNFFPGSHIYYNTMFFMSAKHEFAGSSIIALNLFLEPSASFVESVVVCLNNSCLLIFFFSYGWYISL